MLGPFASASLAEKALYRLPRLLPKHGDRFQGVEGGPTGDAQTWQVGFYQVSGRKTNQPIAVQKPKVKTPGVIEGRIVAIEEGMSWYAIYVEAGGVRYFVQIGGSSGGAQKTSGEINKVGNRVRITYRDKEAGGDGAVYLYASSIVQLK